MDKYQEKHFREWLLKYEHPEYREETESLIRKLLEQDPDLLSDHSWSELRELANAERNFL